MHTYVRNGGLFAIASFLSLAAAYATGFSTTVSAPTGIIASLKREPTEPSILFLPAQPPPPWAAPAGRSAFYARYDGTSVKLARLNLRPEEWSKLEAGEVPALAAGAGGATIENRVTSLLRPGKSHDAAVSSDSRSAELIGSTLDPVEPSKSAHWLRTSEGASSTFFLVSTTLSATAVRERFPVRWIYEMSVPEAEPLGAEASWDRGDAANDIYQQVMKVKFSSPLSTGVLQSFTPQTAARWFSLGRGKILSARFNKQDTLVMFVDRSAVAAPHQYLKPTPAGLSEVLSANGEKLDDELVIVLPDRGEGTATVKQSATLGGGGYSFPSVNVDYTYTLYGEPLSGKDSNGNLILLGETGYQASLKLDAQAKSEFLGHTELAIHKYWLEPGTTHSIRRGMDLGLEADAEAKTLNSIANYSYSWIGGSPMFLARAFGNGYEETRIFATAGVNLDPSPRQFRGERDEFGRAGLMYRFMQRIHPNNKPKDTLLAFDIAANFQYLIEDDFLASFLDAHMLKPLSEQTAIDVRYKVGRDAPNFLSQNIITAGLNIKL